MRYPFHFPRNPRRSNFAKCFESLSKWLRNSVRRNRRNARRLLCCMLCPSRTCGVDSMSWRIT